MSARSPQRSFPRDPDQGLDLAWAPTPRPELVDAKAEADIAHRQAETRDLEDKTARENRREAAEIRFLEAQTQKVTGEVAQQPLEAEERRARIKETEARTEESEVRTICILSAVLVMPLLAAIPAIMGMVEPTHLAGSGLELISQKLFWLRG